MGGTPMPRLAAVPGGTGVPPVGLVCARGNAGTKTARRETASVHRSFSFLILVLVFVLSARGVALGTDEKERA